VAEELDPAPALLREALAEAEVLLWSGRPAPGVRFTARDVLLVPFSLLWGGGALVWEYLALAARAPLVFCLWGLPFVVLGQYMIWGRFVADARRRARLVYGLTVHRAIVAREGWPRTVASFPIDARTEISLVESAGGRGTIRFGGSSAVEVARLQRGAPPFAFESLPMARDVYQMILELQAVAGTERDADDREPSAAPRDR
jgi:hypothetical protein